MCSRISFMTAEARRKSPIPGQELARAQEKRRRSRLGEIERLVLLPGWVGRVPLSGWPSPTGGEPPPRMTFPRRAGECLRGVLGRYQLSSRSRIMSSILHPILAAARRSSSSFSGFRSKKCFVVGISSGIKASEFFLGKNLRKVAAKSSDIVRRSKKWRNRLKFVAIQSNPFSPQETTRSIPSKNPSDSNSFSPTSTVFLESPRKGGGLASAFVTTPGGSPPGL